MSSGAIATKSNSGLSSQTTENDTVLSCATQGRAIDRGLKKQIYQDIFRTPDYFLFDPETLELTGFHLLDGQYQELIANEKGWLWSQQLELYLGIHQGKLRFFTNDEQLVLTPFSHGRTQWLLQEHSPRGRSQPPVPGRHRFLPPVR